MKSVKATIVKALTEAAGNAFETLFRNHNETFYYCSFIFSEEAVPFICANSEEALQHLLHERGLYEGEKYMSEYANYKWSYADSPYYAFGYDDFFGEVEGLFRKRFLSDLSDESYVEECKLWIDSMEEAMSIIDGMGLFGGKTRSIFINAEIMPPDDSNVERAKRLNPQQIFDHWSDELQDDDHEDSCGIYYETWHPKLCDVFLKEMVNDKRLVFKIRKMLNLTYSIIDLLERCQEPSALIAEKVNYNSVLEEMKKYPELEKYLLIKECESYWW